MTRRRPVDRAMAQTRAEKQTMRKLWAQLVRRVAGFSVPPAFYLTLPGANGLDIKELIDQGLITATEVGGIHGSDQDKLLAVEASPAAVLQLQRRFRKCYERHAYLGERC